MSWKTQQPLQASQPLPACLPVQMEPQRVALLHRPGNGDAQRDEHAPAEQQQPQVGLQSSIAGRGRGWQVGEGLACCCACRRADLKSARQSRAKTVPAQHWTPAETARSAVLTAISALMGLLSTSGSESVPVARSSVPLPYWPCCLQVRGVACKAVRLTVKPRGGSGSSWSNLRVRCTQHVCCTPPPFSKQSKPTRSPHRTVIVHAPRSKNERHRALAGSCSENCSHATARGGAGCCGQAGRVLQLDVSG